MINIGNFIGGAGDNKYSSPLNTFYDSANIDTITSGGKAQLLPRLVEIPLNGIGSSTSPANRTQLLDPIQIVSGDNGIDYVRTSRQIVAIWQFDLGFLRFRYMNIIREFTSDDFGTNDAGEDTNSNLGPIAFLTGTRRLPGSTQIRIATNAARETLVVFNSNLGTKALYGEAHSIDPVTFQTAITQEQVRNRLNNLISRYSDVRARGGSGRNEVITTNEPEEQLKDRQRNEPLVLVSGFDQRLYMVYKNLVTWLPVITSLQDEDDIEVVSLGKLIADNDEDETHGTVMFRFSTQEEGVAMIRIGANRFSLYTTNIDSEKSQRYIFPRGLPVGTQVPEYGPHHIDGTVVTAIYWQGMELFCIAPTLALGLAGQQSARGQINDVILYQADGERNIELRNLKFGDVNISDHIVPRGGLVSYKERLYIAHSYKDSGKRLVDAPIGDRDARVRIMGRLDDRYPYQFLHGLRHPHLQEITAIHNGNNGLLVGGKRIYYPSGGSLATESKMFRLSDDLYAEEGYLITNVIPLRGSTFTDGQDIEKFEVVAEMPSTTQIKIEYRIDEVEEKNQELTWKVINDYKNTTGGKTQMKFFSNISAENGKVAQFRFTLRSSDDGKSTPTLVSLVAHTKEIIDR